MRNLVNHWHEVSAFLGGAVAVCAILFVGDPTQQCFFAAIVAMLLHFYEEFGFPGGFPLMGVRILLGSDEPDSTKWHCNNLNSMFGNWMALLLLYIVPVLLPSVHFLTLSGMMFLFAEVLMHLVLFNVRQRSLYNPGMVTGVVLMGAIGLHYFTSVFDAALVGRWDWVLAVVWFVAVVDRFCSANPDISARRLRSALLAVAWNDDDWTFDALEAHYDTLVRYLGMRDCGRVLGGGCGSPGMTRRSGYLKKAFELGRSL